MRNRIFRSICGVAIAVLAILLFFVVGSTYRYFSSTQEQQIQNQLNLVANGVDLLGADYFNSLDIEEIRITWISSDGTVLYDNETAAAGMENHMERPEVREALLEGYGESMRYSSTLLEKQFYCAQRLSDGSVIRISGKYSTVLTLLMGFTEPLCLAVLVILIIAFVFASRISKKIVEPVNAINLDNPLETQTYDELHPLLSRLSVQQTQIRKDRAELLKTEQIRQEFTSNVSHELKTPLHAVSGYAELLKDGLVAQEDIRPFASKIYFESVRLSQLVEDIIDLSRLDAETPGLVFEDTDLFRIAENVVDSMENFALEKGVELRLEGGPVRMQGVPHLLHSILYNLCDNAIKYNREGGTVIIEPSVCPEGAVLTVSDNGIGIPEEHLSRIFERFYRVDKSHSKEVGGTGLGLSIVKHAAGIHNARILVESTLGTGTTVKLIFPNNS